MQPFKENYPIMGLLFPVENANYHDKTRDEGLF